MSNDPATRAPDRLAMRWLGTPYRHQASLRGVGCDCLGLVHGVWRELGFASLSVPAYGAHWGEGHGEEPLLAAARRHLRPADRREPQPGDVAVFRMLRRGPAKHCGIVVRDGRSPSSNSLSFVHAQAGVGTVLSALSEPWLRRVAGLFAFPSPPSERLRP